jgi:hypothetical protein
MVAFAGEILVAADLNAARVRMETQIFTSSGTWSLPTDEDFAGIMVEICGGGGGSGGCAATGASQTSSSGGGQGGAYARFWIPASDLSGDVTVTIGNGGTAGTSAPGNGGDGGATSFGAFGSVPGGEGGSQGGAAGPSSTTQNGGDTVQAFSGTASNPVFIAGSDGGTGLRFASSQSVLPGSGGGSALGPARGIGAISSGQINAVTGRLYGGGAAGPGNPDGSETAQAGAAGGKGVCFVTEVYG